MGLMHGAGWLQVSIDRRLRRDQTERRNGFLVAVKDRRSKRGGEDGTRMHQKGRREDGMVCADCGVERERESAFDL